MSWSSCTRNIASRIKGHLDEVGGALCKGEGGVGRLCSDHDKAQWDGFFSFLRRVLVGEVSNHPGWVLVEVLPLRNVGFSVIVVSFHKVGLGDSTPCRCNRVRLESV